MLLLRNTANFVKVNSPEINQNALIANVSSCKKTSPNFPNRQERKQTIKNKQISTESC